MAVTMLLVLDDTLTDSLAPAVPMASMPTLICRRSATAVTTETGGCRHLRQAAPRRAHPAAALALRLPRTAGESCLDS